MRQLTTIANLIQYCLPALTLNSGVTSLASSAVVEEETVSNAKNINPELTGQTLNSKEQLNHT